MMRLLTMPVARIYLVLGKLCLYMLVTLLQACLMLACGHWLIPLFGLTPLKLTAAPLPLLVVTLCSGLAAVGFALAVASTAGTTDQAGIVGSTTVVLFSALGGAFVPLCFMAPVMQKIALVSPMNWALTAYLDLFVRGARFADIWGRLALLTAFGAAGILWCWGRLFRRA